DQTDHGQDDVEPASAPPGTAALLLLPTQWYLLVDTIDECNPCGRRHRKKMMETRPSGKAGAWNTPCTRCFRGRRAGSAAPGKEGPAGPRQDRRRLPRWAPGALPPERRRVHAVHATVGKGGLHLPRGCLRRPRLGGPDARGRGEGGPGRRRVDR